MIELLKDIIDFQLNDDELIIKLVKEDRILSRDEFLYWWQITRHNEIYKEETMLVKSIHKIQKEIEKVKKLISAAEDNIEDPDEIEIKVKELSAKHDKLANELKEKTSIIKPDVKILEGIRNSFPNKEILDLILNIMKIYLKYK